MGTADDTVVGLSQRRAEILKELEVIDVALKMYADLGSHEAQLHAGAKRKVTQGFTSDAARRKISERMKQVWAERKARKAAG